ncbi:hypothetical protein COBT_002152 [Conglomerata obtusa]
MCVKFGIIHNKVGVEAHRSNGRVERVLSSIREANVKSQISNFNDRLLDIVEKYNHTYHSSIKCTPKEAFTNYFDIKLQERNLESGKWRKRKKNAKKYVEGYLIGDKVRLAKNENIHKDEKGRFLEIGVINAIFIMGLI